MRYFVIFLLVNILLFLVMADKMALKMYWYTVTRPDVYVYLTPYGYFFSVLLIILVHIGILFYVVVIFLYILMTSFYYKSGLLDQARFLTKHPFCFPKIQGRCYHVSNALDINGYIYHDINNKLYWDSLFKSCNVKTPSIYGTIIDSEVDVWIDTSGIDEKGRKLIIKPTKLYSANGIKWFDADSLPAQGSYIIQEYIQSYNKYPHSIRIVTIRRPDKTFEWMTTLSVNSDETSLTTNVGGRTVTDYEIKGEKARNVLGEQWVEHHIPLKYLEEAIESAVKLHENMRYKLSSVGWDVIIASDGPYFLEGNMCHGIVRKKDIFYYDRLSSFIKFAYM